jgi:hypothetical protein
MELEGQPFVCEIKHVSDGYCDGVLEPERILNPRTGKLNKTKRNLSHLKPDALNGDTRGYLTQLAVYSEALGMPGLLFLWDKKKNRVNVVPLDETTKILALMHVDDIIPKLQEIEDVSDVFRHWAVPEPQEKKLRGNPTGEFYLPFAIRYSNADLLSCLYQFDEDGETVLDVRPTQEAIARLQLLTLTEEKTYA